MAKKGKQADRQGKSAPKAQPAEPKQPKEEKQKIEYLSRSQALLALPEGHKSEYLRQWGNHYADLVSLWRRHGEKYRNLYKDFCEVRNEVKRLHIVVSTCRPSTILFQEVPKIETLTIDDFAELETTLSEYSLCHLASECECIRDMVDYNYAYNNIRAYIEGAGYRIRNANYNNSLKSTAADNNWHV